MTNTKGELWVWIVWQFMQVMTKLLNLPIRAAIAFNYAKLSLCAGKGKFNIS